MWQVRCAALRRRTPGQRGRREARESAAGRFGREGGWMGDRAGTRPRMGQARRKWFVCAGVGCEMSSIATFLATVFGHRANVGFRPVRAREVASTRPRSAVGAACTGRWFYLHAGVADRGYHTYCTAHGGISHYWCVPKFLIRPFSSLSHFGSRIPLLLPANGTVGEVLGRSKDLLSQDLATPGRDRGQLGHRAPCGMRQRQRIGRWQDVIHSSV